MKINHKILCIPPYISTSWKNVLSLQTENCGPHFTLIVSMLDGSKTEIPYLEESVVHGIFAAHAKHLEGEALQKPSPLPFNGKTADSSSLLELPLQLNNPKLEEFGALLQHNADNYNTPNLPEEILTKITTLTKAIGIEDMQALPKPEPHCNCHYCQIAKAMQKSLCESCTNIDTEQSKEEEITEDDLRFHSWSIQKIADQLYTVTNPDDAKEQYQVFLGSPIGCTCGSDHCEHIRSVLNT